MELVVERIGLVGYEECLERQRALNELRKTNSIPDTLLVCSHDPVITLGRSTRSEHITTPRPDLEARGLKVLEVERGGSITYHGPEQIVCYPILDLKQHKQDVGWYIRNLEEVIIRTLADFGLNGFRIAGKTGVWTEPEAKIAFIGVKISRWCTFHGFSLNVKRCLTNFAYMNPCGLGEIVVTSIEELTNKSQPYEPIEERLVKHFRAIFDYS